MYTSTNIAFTINFGFWQFSNAYYTYITSQHTTFWKIIYIVNPSRQTKKYNLKTQTLPFNFIVKKRLRVISILSTKTFHHNLEYN